MESSIVVLVFAALVLPSPVQAIDATDPLQDEGVMAQGTLYPTPGQFPEVDLSRLTVRERDTAIEVAWQAQEYPKQPLYDNLLTKFVLSFSVDGQRYEILNRACGPDASLLGIFAPGAPFSTKVDCLPHDIAGTEFVVAVPKALLRTGDGGIAGFGTRLSDFSLLASHDAARATGTTLAEAYDDLLPGNASLVLSKGAFALGNASLVPSPMLRLTNGAETLLVHTVDVFGARGSPIEFRVDGLPAGWTTHTLPPLSLSDTATVPLVIAVPFAHAHGTANGFDIIAEDGQTRAKMRMHIEYLETPQPAGHHPIMWLHGREEPAGISSQRHAWINAREDDPRADGAPAPLGQRGSGTNESYGQFVLPLEPSLLIGLDADLTEPGVANLQILGGSIDVEGRVEVTVFRCDASEAGEGLAFGQECPTGSMLVMATGRTPLQVAANQEVMASIPLVLDEAADYVPVGAGDNLFLVVEVFGDLLVFESQATQPQLGTRQGFLELPLLEFRNHAAILEDNTLQVSLEWPAALEAGRDHVISIAVPEASGPIYQVALGAGINDSGRWLDVRDGYVDAVIPVGLASDPGVYEIALILVSDSTGTYAVLPHMVQLLAASEAGSNGETRSTPLPVWISVASLVCIRAFLRGPQS